MIEFSHVSYTYPDQGTPALLDLSVQIAPGEMVLVVGPSGAGKSTFLRCLNGLVPHFYGGHWAGHTRVFGRDPVGVAPRGMANLVGFVFQDPESQFVVDTVEDELAFAMENFAIPQATMRKRVEEVLDQLGIAHLRRRRISTLSGGEKQRVAIAAVLALQPEVLVLDEPTSQLDPQGAEEVLGALRQLNEELGLTIIFSEHRLERVVQHVDRVLYLPACGAVPMLGDARTVMAALPLVPPLIELGRRLGWQPLPLTIREARPHARPLVQQFAATRRPAGNGTASSARTNREGAAGVPVLEVQDVHYSYEGQVALRGVKLAARQGEFIALMGRNGSGKSTLLKQLVGLLRPDQGKVLLAGQDTQALSRAEVIRRVGYVPQHPGALLFQESLAGELAFTRRGHGMPANPGEDRALLERLGLEAVAGRDPRDLSGGEQQRAALAAILVANPEIILLDEPTRGLDYSQKQALIQVLAGLQANGRTIIMATHDVELVAACADRVVLLAEGEVVVDGPARDVMSDSQVFASQINKLFRDPRFLVVADVLLALDR